MTTVVYSTGHIPLTDKSIATHGQLPIAIVKEAQSLPDDDLARFCQSLDFWIRRGTQNPEQTVEELLISVFGAHKGIELAAKLRTSTPINKSFLDYIRLDKPLVFIDLETTSTDKETTKIVEISLIKYFPNGEKETLTLEIDPEIGIPREASNVNHFTNEKLQGCPKFRLIAQGLKEFLNDCHLGGYNIIDFDTYVLKKEFERARIEFNLNSRALIDSMVIFHKKVPKEKLQDTIRKIFGLEIDDKDIQEFTSRTLTTAYKLYCGKKLLKAHGANADITASVEIFTAQLEQYPELPKDIYELSTYCTSKNPEYVDRYGKFKWVNGEAVLSFGNKHNGKTLKEVARIDAGYLRWIITQDFKEEIKQICQNALRGIFPNEQTYQSPESIIDPF